ncbi:MAG: glycosyltransferase [Burkholderiales bacterium]|nr:glycosyltransferase [Burkholderiales bacterium]
MNPGVALSVVMPACNEEASIDTAIAEIVEQVFGVVEDAELVVVDDGSRDGTRTEPTDLSAMSVHRDRRSDDDGPPGAPFAELTRKSAQGRPAPRRPTRPSPIGRGSRRSCAAVPRRAARSATSPAARAPG